MVSKALLPGQTPNLRGSLTRKPQPPNPLPRILGPGFTFLRGWAVVSVGRWAPAAPSPTAPRPAPRSPRSPDTHTSSPQLGGPESSRPSPALCPQSGPPSAVGCRALGGAGADGRGAGL